MFGGSYFGEGYFGSVRKTGNLLTKVLSATQSQLATLTISKVTVKVLSALQSQLASLTRSRSIIISAIQSQLAKLVILSTSQYNYVSINGQQYGHGSVNNAVWIIDDSIDIQEYNDETPNTATLDLIGPVPVLYGKEIIITRQAVRRFGGRIIGQTQQLVDIDNNTVLKTHLSCIDYTWRMNRYKVNATYSGQFGDSIVKSLVATYCPGYTTSSIPSLGFIDTITFVNQDVTDCLTAIKRRLGTRWKCDYYKDINMAPYSLVNINPNSITSDPTSQFQNLQVNVDLSQIVTRAVTKCTGASVLAQFNTQTETIIPLDNTLYMLLSGGTVQIGTQRVTYTGIQAGGTGSLVGPGAAPSGGPALALSGGGSVNNGLHYYAVTFTTASGESLPGPTSSITTGSLAAPTSAVSTTLNEGGQLGIGTYYYAYTYVTSAGETTVSPTFQATTKQVASPANSPSVVDVIAGDPSVSPGTGLQYAYTYASGDNSYETSLSPATSWTTSAYYATPSWSNSRNVTVNCTTDSSAIIINLYRNRGAGWKRIQSGLNSTSPGQTVTFTDTTASEGAAPLNNGLFFAAFQISGISTGPSGVIARKLYRTTVNGSQLKLYLTINDNTTTSVSDSSPDSALGANAPTTNTAAQNTVLLSSIPLGGTAVTGRKVYRTVAGATQLKLLATIADNTTTTLTDTTADASLGANAPTSDLSGLSQPAGQVLPGATSCPVANPGAFYSIGGWAIIGNGQQVIRYTGKSGQTITGIPATGFGSIYASITYGSTITTAPAITGVPAGTITVLPAPGDPADSLAIVNDTNLQAAFATLLNDPNDPGIREDYVDSTNDFSNKKQVVTYTEAVALGEARLAINGNPIITISYTCRDPLSRAGADVTVILPSPWNISGTFTIVDVQVNDMGASDPATSTAVPPTFTVKATSQRFSLESVLHALLGG